MRSGIFARCCNFSRAQAPARHEAFRTTCLGAYGRNLDYNQICEGTSLYLGVNVPRALLFIGDGHAVQGDGEFTGDALETSLEVAFSVTLIRGAAPASSRAENAEYLMAFGITNSLPEAVQAATTNLAAWLQDDYHLFPNESALILGAAIEYNLAELVDPSIHVVARIRRDALAGLK